MKNPYAVIIKVSDFWWKRLFYKNSRAMAAGNTILLGPKEEVYDLEHEFVHIRQHDKLPFIYPIFYYYETFRNGYRNNKYEVEAYRFSGDMHRGK